MKKTVSAPIEKTLQDFLLLAYRRMVDGRYAKATALADLARELGVADGLGVKIAVFLESEGLVDYDDQAIDVTIPGMMRAEALLRGDGAAKTAKTAKRAKP